MSRRGGELNELIENDAKVADSIAVKVSRLRSIVTTHSSLRLTNIDVLKSNRMRKHDNHPTDGGVIYINNM